MRTVVRERIGSFVRSSPRLSTTLRLTKFLVRTAAGPVLHCPLCDEDHRFLPMGSPPRLNALCPSCNSAERHRLLGLYLTQNPHSIRGRSVLHFAPERALTTFLAGLQPASYLTADITPGRADIALSIENIDLSERFDVVIASHILEHVNDRVALREIYNALDVDGLAIIMVPIIEGWASTYENSNVETEADRLRHFGQEDHLRLYGRDLRDRIREAGFELNEFTASPGDCLSMGLLPGETIFLASKRHRSDAAPAGF
jgi:SAM-dependent methyltransferase